MINRYLNSIVLDANGNLWCGLTNEGYLKINLESKSIQKFDPDKTYVNRLRNNVTNLDYDGDSTLYIATLQGLYTHNIFTNVLNKSAINNLLSDEFCLFVKYTNNRLLIVNKGSAKIITNLKSGNFELNESIKMFNQVGAQKFCPYFNPNIIGVIINNKITDIENELNRNELNEASIVVEEINTENGIRKVFTDAEQMKQAYNFTANPNDNNLTIEIGFPNQPLNNEAKLLFSIDNSKFILLDKNVINLNELSYGKHIINVKVEIDGYSLAKNFIQIYININKPFYIRWWFLMLLGLLIFTIVLKRLKFLNKALFYKRTLNDFATSLFKFNKVDEVFWEVSKNAITKLGHKECVMYIVDYNLQKCVPIAAYGSNIINKESLKNVAHIAINQKSIVAKTARTGKAIFLPDTTKDDDYLIDGKVQLSEICVPIIIDNKVFGIIDCEDEKKNFFKKADFEFLKEVANICSLKITKYIVQQNIREEIARDLHDDIGGTLHSISLQTTLATMQLNTNQENAKITLEKIGNTSRNMIEKMNDIIWSINPENDGWNNYYKRAKNFAAEILSEHNIALEMNEKVDYPVEMQLNIEARKNLYLFFKEVITNAAKYSKARTVFINIVFKQELIELIIKDDGIGFSTEEVKQNSFGGNGLFNIKQRAKLLKGVLEYKSIIGKGTTVVLKFPPSNI